MPLVADYSFAAVKDSAFSLFTIALIPVLLAVRAGAGRLLSARRGSAVVVVVLAGFALIRSNALPVVLVILALMVWWSRARLRRALAVSAVVLIVVVTPSALTTRSQHAEEAVGIPLQTVGYTLTHDADCLPPASRQLFNNVLAPETWKQAYRPSSVDPVKDSPAFNGAYLDAHRGQFLSAWGAGPGGVPPTIRHRLPRPYRQSVALRRRPGGHRWSVPFHLRGLESPGRP